MSSKSKGKDNASKFDFSYKNTVWANVTLSAEDTAEVIERAKDVTENLGDMLSLFASGCNISLKHRADGTTVSVVAIFAAGVHGNNPTGLSAFAPDAQTAVSALLYKYFVVADSRLADYVSSSSSRIG